MSNHIEFGHAAQGLAAIYTRDQAIEELLLEDDDEETEPFILCLWNLNCDGLALRGTRHELLDYLSRVISLVERETDLQLSTGHD